MIRFAATTRATRVAAVTFAATLAASAGASLARADTALPASASTVRNAIVAMSLADAAMPFATAIAATREERVVGLPASAALKPETAGAMASVRTASARSSGSYGPASYERRAQRPYRDPFLLILGVAY